MRKILSSILFLIGLSAVAGGTGLITGRIAIPVSNLAGSWFASYLWPGIILAVVVGGTHLVAAVLFWRQSKYDLESLAIAGFGMSIWMFTEVCIVGYHSWLQPLYFGLASLTLIVVMGLLKYGNGPVSKATFDV